jgi:hypothetical protein
MEDAPEADFPSPEKSWWQARIGWEALWFLLHLGAVYAIVEFCTPFLAGWIHGRVLPFVPNPSSASKFEFLFSHIFALSFIPGFLGGLINARFEHRFAQYVWVIPTAILAYKFATCPTQSVFQNQLLDAFHLYFGGGFRIPEIRTWHDLRLIGATPDMRRGMAQLTFTAPFYSGIGYSLAAWIGLRTEINRKIVETVTT